MKKNSIASKILRAFLLVCLVSLGISGIVTVLSLFNIRRITLENSSTIGAAAADSSAETLRRQTILDLTELVQAQSEIINHELLNALNGLELIKNYAEKIYRSPGNFLPRPFANYHAVPPETLQMHWFFNYGVVSNPQFNDSDLRKAGMLNETYLLGNLETIVQLVNDQNPNISSIYFSTRQGLNIQYDKDAAIKVVLVPYFISHERPWFIYPHERNDIYISDAYYDGAGRGLCLTMSCPYYDTSGNFMGVAGLDIGIADLDENVRQTVAGKSGYAILINNHAGKDGSESRMISAPGLSGDNENDIAVFLGDRADEILAQMRALPSGQDRSSVGVIVWTPVNLTGWQLAYIVPEEEIFAPAQALQHQIIEMTGITIRQVNTTIIIAMVISGVLLLLLIMVTLGAARYISGKITQPITILSEHIRTIGGGNLDYRSGIKTGDEIEELDLSFERMTGELKNYITSLNQVTAEKERIGAELNVATRIQASMLPRIFPPFPNREEFDLYGSMLPAKEVGGDFYDFFLIDENTLVILIADVSGKGIPAALFMVTAKTLIKNSAQRGLGPCEVFETVNNELCTNNEEGMFVTAFMGYLDIPSGNFTCVNAGHNPPLVKRGDSFEWLKTKRGLVLAGMENMRYREEQITLKKGDMVYLYTDGVTEAVNPKQELFTDPRLLEVANKHKNAGLKDFVHVIKSEIDIFAEGAEQADDITMLMMEYRGIVK
jgi:sigma-B regulation protein RsbU (phosphoserine phosphatase)